MKYWVLLGATLLMSQCRTSQPIGSVPPGPAEAESVKLNDFTKAGINVDKFPSAAKALQLAQAEAKQVPLNSQEPGAKDRKALLDAIQAVKPQDLETLMREQKCTRTLKRLVAWNTNTGESDGLNLAATQEEEDRRKNVAKAAIVLGAISMLSQIHLIPYVRNLNNLNISKQIKLSIGATTAAYALITGVRILLSDGKDEEVVKNAKTQLFVGAGIAALGSLGFGFIKYRSELKVGRGIYMAVVEAASTFIAFGAVDAALLAGLNLAEAKPDLQKLKPEERLEALSLGVFAACAMEEIKASESQPIQSKVQ